MLELRAKANFFLDIYPHQCGCQAGWHHPLRHFQNIAYPHQRKENHISLPIFIFSIFF